jgi:hypothetical protein
MQPAVGGRRVWVGGGPDSGTLFAQFGQRHSLRGIDQPVGLGRVGGGRATDQRRLRRGQLAAAQRLLHPALVGEPLRGAQRVLGLSGAGAGGAGQLLGGRPGATGALMGFGDPPGQQGFAGRAQPFGRVEDPPQLPSSVAGAPVRVQLVNQLGQPVPHRHHIFEHVYDTSRRDRQTPRQTKNVEKQ